MTGFITHSLAFLAGGFFGFVLMSFCVAVAEYSERHGGSADED